MEAHGVAGGQGARITAVGLLPDAVAKPLIDKIGDRPAAARCTRPFKAVRRGGTVSISGVYGGEADPMPMMEMFDKGITCGWASAT